MLTERDALLVGATLVAAAGSINSPRQGLELTEDLAALFVLMDDEVAFAYSDILQDPRNELFKEPCDRYLLPAFINLLYPEDSIMEKAMPRAASLPCADGRVFEIFNKNERLPYTEKAAKPKTMIKKRNNLLRNQETHPLMKALGYFFASMAVQSFAIEFGIFEEEENQEFMNQIGSSVLGSFFAFNLHRDADKILHFWTRNDLQRAGMLHYASEPYGLEAYTEDFFMRAKHRFIKNSGPRKQKAPAKV